MSIKIDVENVDDVSFDLSYDFIVDLVHIFLSFVCFNSHDFLCVFICFDSSCSFIDCMLRSFVYTYFSFDLSLYVDRSVMECTHQ